MKKPFNIHDWQANQIKQRLFEKEGVKHYTKDGKEWTGKTHKMPNGKLMTQNPHNEDSEELFHKEDLKEDEDLNKMNSQGDMFGRGPAYQELDSGIQYYIDEFIKDIEEGNKKDGTEYLNDLILAIVALRDSATYEDDLEEASMIGTGASFTAGSGAGYMTPNAFKKIKKK